MVDDPYEIILEHLRAMRSDIHAVRDDVREMKLSQTSLREEVHALRGDILRQERAIATVEADIDRIKIRLDLSES